MFLEIGSWTFELSQQFLINSDIKAERGSLFYRAFKFQSCRIVRILNSLFKQSLWFLKIYSKRGLVYTLISM